MSDGPPTGAAAAPVELSAASVEALARRTAELLADRLDRPSPAAGELVDAGEVARHYGVTRSWVYEHADELGAVRLGDGGAGRRPRLRFDPERVEQALQAASDPPPAPAIEASPARRRRRRPPAGDAQLLPIRGDHG